MSTTFVSPGVLDVRRERAVQRAITRACQQPTDARVRLVDHLRGLPAEYYEIRGDAVRVGPGGYWIDGVHACWWAVAVELLRDRYGLTGAEAEALLP